MIGVFCRTILVYIFLLIIMRCMGKRQIGELQVSELIVTFMLSELAVNPISDPDMPLLHAVIPILLLLSIEVILSFVLTKSCRLRKLLSGSPAVLICKGHLDQRAMAENRLEIDELLAELRQKGFGDPESVDYAILEGNGKISVFPKAGMGAVSWQELQQGVCAKGIAHAVIVDGEWMKEGLSLAGKDIEWAERVLRKKRMERSAVFLMTTDDSGHINIIGKEEAE